MSPEEKLKASGLRPLPPQTTGETSGRPKPNGGGEAEMLQLPLIEQSQPSPFPIDALGDVLSGAASAIAAKVQCAPAMAAQSVLAVASLAAQGLVDVLLPYGQPRPDSLFALTIAASGDRKTSADKEAMIPVRMREKKLGETFKILKEIHAIDSASWR